MLPVNGGGGRGREFSSWAVWTGAEYHTGPAAGVPDGRLQVCLFPSPAFVSVPASPPSHQAHTACSGMPGTAAGGSLMEVAFQAHFS